MDPKLWITIVLVGIAHFYPSALGGLTVRQRLARVFPWALVEFIAWEIALSLYLPVEVAIGWDAALASICVGPMVFLWVVIWVFPDVGDRIPK